MLRNGSYANNLILKCCRKRSVVVFLCYCTLSVCFLEQHNCFEDGDNHYAELFMGANMISEAFLKYLIE